MADEKIDLPDGGWALLRDPRRVTERQRRPVTRLQARLAGSAVGALLAQRGNLSDKKFEEEARKVLGSDDYGLLDDLNDALIEALVDSWSYEDPPSAAAAMDKPGPVYDKIKRECAKHVTALTPDFSPTDESLADPASPTGPSAG